ncbi:8993_t:CDS:2 [Ambispora gerdemannii]|uniref:8993_t:CDS:1 n=1 Tax=Ambispora gerdemannii TaxID=144530 RepID=A0A9N9DDU2_9GLOM|nr:8993_t:CDS:2 [Ambispora gerdemannii]
MQSLRKTYIPTIPTSNTITIPPSCYCFLPTTIWRTYKNGKNYGRWFWRCSRFGTEDDLEKCNYFKWTDNNDNDNITKSPSSRPSVNTLLPQSDDSFATITDENENDILKLEQDATSPEFTTLEFLEIVERHLKQQDYRISTRAQQNNELISQLEKARKEMEALKCENDILRRENNLLKREIDLTKEEIRYERESKRRKTS